MRIEIITPELYSKSPRLMQNMFLDRATQFKGRMGWDVNVSDDGEERDQYDLLRPTYLVAQNNSGKHLGSMRFLPLSGPTMLFDHFSELIPKNFLNRPNEYECTRFCIAPDLDAETARLVIPSLLLEGCKFALRSRCPSTLGIFHPIMLRVYKRSGWPPTVLGIKNFDGETIIFGRWEVDETRMLNLESRISELHGKTSLEIQV